MSIKIEDLDSEYLDELVQEAASRMATKVNNAGVVAQIAYLRTMGYTDSEIERHLPEPANT